MKTFEIRSIKSEDDHDWSIAQIEAFWESREGTPEFEYLMVLSDLVSAYEDTHYPVEVPDPIDMILFHMDQNGLDQAALAKVFQSKSRASEVLNRKKGLSISQIRALHKEWHLPAEILIQESRLEAAG